MDCMRINCNFYHEIVRNKCFSISATHRKVILTLVGRKGCRSLWGSLWSLLNRPAPIAPAPPTRRSETVRGARGSSSVGRGATFSEAPGFWPGGMKNEGKIKDEKIIEKFNKQRKIFFKNQKQTQTLGPNIFL